MPGHRVRGFPTLGVLRVLRHGATPRGLAPLLDQHRFLASRMLPLQMHEAADNKLMPGVLQVSRCSDPTYARDPSWSPTGDKSAETQRADSVHLSASQRASLLGSVARGYLSPKSRMSRFVFLYRCILSLDPHLGLLPSPHGPFSIRYLTYRAPCSHGDQRLTLLHSQPRPDTDSGWNHSLM